MAQQGARFSMETDSTIKDIWTLSHRPSAEFNPEGVGAVIDMKRQIREGTMARQGPSAAGDQSFSLTGLLEGESPVPMQGDRSRAMQRRSMNLQKSIAMLDDAVSTPSSILRSGGNRKTPRMLKHSSYTPQHIPTGSKFDVTGALGFNTPGSSMMVAPGSTMASISENTMGSFNITTARTVNDSALDQANATSNVALLLEEDPAIAECNGMFGDFMQIMKANAAEHQLFSLMEEYEKICTDNVALLKKLNKNTVPGHSKFAKILDTYELLNQEKCTWRLITSLYKDRLETETKQTESMLLDNLGQHQSEKQIVNNFFESETSVRQAQLVVDWLERNAVDQLEDYYDRVEFFTDKNGGAAWENTLHDLQQRGQGNPMNWDKHMVNELDPDAPFRQKKPLSDLDTEDELRLLKYLFTYVRAGQLDEAQKLCDKVGQPWRAATLEGWRLYHDPNHSGESPLGTVTKVEGNPNRDVWKAVCWRMADQEKFNMFERALYAVFSGNLKQLLPACDSWEDYLWGYFKVFIDNHVEQEIRLNCTHNKPLEDLPRGYLDKLMSIESIFQEIQASSNDGIRMQCKEQYHIIQKYIILGDIDSLIEEMYEWSRDELYIAQPHLMRFMAHLVLFFRTVGVNAKEELCNAVLEGYVRYLILDKQTPLIAVYVSTLPQDAQVEWYAKYLESVTETDQRKHCLQLAEDAGLDIQSVTKLVVENIRKQDSEFLMDGDLNSDSGISDEDRQKINAIEWLVFDPAQRAEAMRQANAVMRTFLTTRKLTATRAVFNKLPEDSIHTIITLWKMQTGSAELNAEDDNTIREYLCIKSYLDSHDSFNDWFEHYHNSKPVKPEIPHGANFTERVAFEHREKQYESELERWEHALTLQSTTTVDKLYNVLLFPNGGWMVDQREDGHRDEQRSHQMRLLRQLCLPNLAFLLQTVLHATGQHKKCLQMADVIASEIHGLYKVFRKDELQKLLQKLRESAVAILDSGLDPTGYPMLQ